MSLRVALETLEPSVNATSMQRTGRSKNNCGPGLSELGIAREVETTGASSRSLHPGPRGTGFGVRLPVSRRRFQRYDLCPRRKETQGLRPKTGSSSAGPHRARTPVQCQWLLEMAANRSPRHGWSPAHPPPVHLRLRPGPSPGAVRYGHIPAAPHHARRGSGTDSPDALDRPEVARTIVGGADDRRQVVAFRGPFGYVSQVNGTQFDPLLNPESNSP